MTNTFDITQLSVNEQTKLVALVDCLSDLLDMAKNKINKKEGNSSVEEGMKLPGIELIEQEVKKARSMIEGAVVDPELWQTHSRAIRNALSVGVSGLNATVQEQAKEISGNSLSEGEAVDKVKDLAQKHEQNVFSSLTENANAMVSKVANQALGLANAVYAFATPEDWQKFNGPDLAVTAMKNSTAAHRSTGKAHSALEKAVSKMEGPRPHSPSHHDVTDKEIKAPSFSYEITARVEKKLPEAPTRSRHQ